VELVVLLLLRHLLLRLALDAAGRVGGWLQYQLGWYLVVVEWSWTMRRLVPKWK